ncbi:endonuclease/exonuclease/phosphatase family metal-dependent hydrolase [Nonomuraea thailandensis]|uniref:Endonuclease/exonuclease/phosphatase family metal-dependent hydrolase n=1 Tax=Nonomuraea thailandensis TaxID=1188745 RepID=A0A9X2K2E4_9ACTN|nr:endonuclease/exonuclease/phosphatase family protein [Nonomuraea thailandensis]MCP2354461.1 endonuclease/exonuclease/phosphatase family metal-dependent hydrolase [Nonomuraea thailandensis]
MRVVTLNLWARHGSWNRRRQLLIDGLRDLDPDLVALQESVVTDDYDQVVDLLGPGYHVMHQEGGEADGTRASIASRWPLRETWQTRLDVTARVDPSEFAGWVGLAEVLVPELRPAPLLFVNHKPSFRLGHEHERELQAVRAARLVEEAVANRDIGHVIVAGDFDATPESASVRFWSGLQSLEGISVAYRDVWRWAHPNAPGHTFTPVNPLVRSGNWPLETGRRIDYLFVRCHGNGPTLRLLNCRQIFDHPVDGVWAGDHFGLMADLEAMP